ncbi:MAG: DinB family protein [Phycisphaerales bacterium]|nr:DinB family protein [Phycisphaerales bacterium]
MSGIERYRKLLIAETRATALALQSIASIPDANRAGHDAQRALGIMAHIQLARRIWLERAERLTSAPVPDWFPASPPEQTAKLAAELDRSWSAFLDSIRDPDLDRPVLYSNIKGEKFTSTLDDILIHVFNHSTYHRGQVARLVTDAGGQRAQTDYIGFFRTPQA